MSKKKKELEREIIAQMEEALQEQKAEKETEGGTLPTESEEMQIHCHKCKVLMENGKCPSCGRTMYTPMDARQQRKVRWILTGICLVVLIILLLVK